MLKPFSCALFLLAGTALAAPPDTARFVTAADGGRIAYYPLLQVKTVPLLVLSGGPGSDCRYMRVRGALDELARTRSVVFFDQRGTAQSSDSTGMETIDLYVEDLEAIRKALGAPQVDLLGHSFGGYLAMAYTAKHPAQVRGLVFVDSSTPKPNDLTQLMDPVFPDRVEEWRTRRATLGRNATGADIALFQSMEFVDAVARDEFLHAVNGFRYNLEVNNTLRRDMAKLDFWPQVRQLKQPALVIHGRFDVIIAPANSWALHKALPSSEFHVIEAAGHLPHVERPEAFLAVVRPFLEGLDRKVAPETAPY